MPIVNLAEVRKQKTQAELDSAVQAAAAEWVKAADATEPLDEEAEAFLSSDYGGLSCKPDKTGREWTDRRSSNGPRELTWFF